MFTRCRLRYEDDGEGGEKRGGGDCVARLDAADNSNEKVIGEREERGHSDGDGAERKRKSVVGPYVCTSFTISGGVPL